MVGTHCNWKAMQIVETTVDNIKERRAPGDVNIRQMSMGSWHASLSRSGQAHPAFKSPRGQGALPDRKKKK